MSFGGKRVWKKFIACVTNVTAFQKVKMIIKNLRRFFFKKARPEKEQLKTLIPGRRDLLEIYQKLRIRYPHTQTLKTFVETGTFHGETIRKMEPFFERLITIEIAPKLHQEARTRHPSPKILYILGDSVTELGKISQELSHPTLFYLDAHFSGAGTGKGVKDVPLIEEMEILGKRPHLDCIIVDDVRLFGTRANQEDWSAVTRDSILRLLGHYELEIIEQGDKLILLKCPI